MWLWKCSIADAEVFCITANSSMNPLSHLLFNWLTGGTLRWLLRWTFRWGLRRWFRCWLFCGYGGFRWLSSRWRRSWLQWGRHPGCRSWCWHTGQKATVPVCGKRDELTVTQFMTVGLPSLLNFHLLSWSELIHAIILNECRNRVAMRWNQLNHS